MFVCFARARIDIYHHFSKAFNVNIGNNYLTESADIPQHWKYVILNNRPSVYSFGSIYTRQENAFQTPADLPVAKQEGNLLPQDLIHYFHLEFVNEEHTTALSDLVSSQRDIPTSLDEWVAL